MLANETCVACRPGAEIVAPDVEADLLVRLPGWDVVETNGVRKLRRVYAFQEWMAGIRFAERVGHLADATDHHPTILITWGKVTVTWWTHVIGGLHRNDFIMADRTNLAYEDKSG